METTAEPFPTSGGESTVDALELSTASTRTAEDMIERVPGFETVQHGAEGKGHQFFVRGFDAVHGSDVEVRLEGVPLNEPSNVHGNGYLDLGFVVSETVMRLEARKGSFDILQGPFATAGSINFELGVPAWERGIRTLYEAGTTNRHRLAAVVAPESSPRETFAAVEAMHDDGFGANRRSRRVSALAQARLLGDDDVTVTGLVAAYGADFGLPGTVRLEDATSGKLGFYDAYVDTTTGSSLRAIASVRLLADTEGGEWRASVWGQGRQLELDENFTGFLEHPERGDRRVQREDSWTLGGRLRWAARVAPTADVKSVLEWRSVWADQREVQLTTTGETWGTERSLAFTDQLGGLGVALDWSPLSWMRLVAGARADVVGLWARDRLQQESGREWFVVPSPRLRAAFYPGIAWTLFAAYGRGLRPPEARSVVPAPRLVDPENRDNALYEGGEPSPTTTDHAEIGARWDVSDDIVVDATVFGVLIQRESVFDHVSGVSVELNGTRRFGVESSVSWRPFEWFDVGASLTAVDARFVESGNPVPGAPRILGSTSMSMVHPEGWRGGLEARALGARPLGHGAESAPFALLDATAGYRWRWIQLDLLVENVTGAQWREGEYHYASSWNRAEPASRLPVIHYVAGAPRVVRATLSAWF